MALGIDPKIRQFSPVPAPIAVRGGLPVIAKSGTPTSIYCSIDLSEMRLPFSNHANTICAGIGDLGIVARCFNIEGRTNV